MPVVMEREDVGALGGAEFRPRTRRWGRGWLALPCSLLALLIAAPIVPLVRPVKIQAGGRMTIVGTNVMPSVGSKSPLPQGFSTLLNPTSGDTEDMEHVHYLVKGPVHIYAVRVKDWVYHLAWFRGHRQ
jgi:hypothetical protein